MQGYKPVVNYLCGHYGDSGGKEIHGLLGREPPEEEKDTAAAIDGASLGGCIGDRYFCELFFRLV
jgi:hypothetical protein